MANLLAELAASDVVADVEDARSRYRPSTSLSAAAIVAVEASGCEDAVDRVQREGGLQMVYALLVLPTLRERVIGLAAATSRALELVEGNAPAAGGVAEQLRTVRELEAEPAAAWLRDGGPDDDDGGDLDRWRRDLRVHVRVVLATSIPVDAVDGLDQGWPEDELQTRAQRLRELLVFALALLHHLPIRRGTDVRA